MSLDDTTGWLSSSAVPNFKPDQPLTPRYIQRVLKSIERATPRNGSGYEVHASPKGWTLGLPYGATSKKLRFFIVTVYQKNGSYVANVSAGMVNRTIPKMDGQFIDKSGEPPSVPVADGDYVGVEVSYMSGLVFPNVAIITTRQNLLLNDTENKSFYPLASISIDENLNADPTQNNYEIISVTQLCDTNLVVNRMKVGINVFSWSWSN